MAVYSSGVFDSTVFETDETGMAGAATITISAAAILTSGISLAGAATIVLTGAGVLTTAIPLAGSALITITTAADRLLSRGVAGIREDCGHPIMSLKNWQNPNSC